MPQPRRRRSPPRLGYAGGPVRAPLQAPPPPVAEVQEGRRRIEADRIQGFLEEAQRMNSPHVDIGPLLGHTAPLLLGVNDLHEAVMKVAFGGDSLPALSLRWDQSELTVEHVEGGALAKLTFKF